MLRHLVMQGQSWAAITRGVNKWALVRSTFSFLGYHVPTTPW